MVLCQYPQVCQYLDIAHFTLLHGICWYSSTFDVIRLHATNKCTYSEPPNTDTLGVRHLSFVERLSLYTSYRKEGISEGN